MFFSGLERAILEVIVYFDIFSRPLTTFEIWKNLRISVAYGEVVEALETSAWLKERLMCKDGMWALHKAKLCAGERAVQYRISKYKLDIAQRFARLARFIPGVRGIYACNTLGFLSSRSESDIDLFVVTRRGRIWTVRFFAVLFAKLFFRRPHGNHTKDAICLSFLAVENADMRKVALEGGDPYYEYWMKNLLPLSEKSQKSQRGQKGQRMEKVLRWVQLKIMPAHLKAMANKGTSVVINEEFLKFHDHDRREYYREEFTRRFAAVAG